MRSIKLGLLQNELDVLVKDPCLKGLNALAEVPNDRLEAIVVGDLLERKFPHLLQVELDTFNPRVDILCVDEVLLDFDKVLVVLLLIFEPITLVLAKQSDEAVSHTL
jgi:hypothetical protein